MGAGLVDVSINANIGRIENGTGRRLQPFAHGTYSLGVLVGAVGAGLARGAASVASRSSSPSPSASR